MGYRRYWLRKARWSFGMAMWFFKLFLRDLLNAIA